MTNTPLFYIREEGFEAGQIVLLRKGFVTALFNDTPAEWCKLNEYLNKPSPLGPCHVRQLTAGDIHTKCVFK